MNRTFLFEIGLEEMPARFVTNAMNQLGDKIVQWLEDNRLTYGNIKRFSTPRRLAILIEDLEEKQVDMEEEARGPSRKIALDSEGNWTKAAIGFSRGQGVPVDELFFKEVKGEEYVFVKKFTEGQDTSVLLKELKSVVEGLQFPKNMKWGSQKLRYVRPIKWLVAMYGSEIIPFKITNVETGNISYGHRFLGSSVSLDDPGEYPNLLLGQFVLVNPTERKEAIVSQIDRISESEGWRIPVDEELLEEVNNLVEYPTALYGSFNERYLSVPEDVLITSMKEHQRYFPVKNKEGKLLPHFITIRNGDHRHLENVQKGNEKVLRARLADAEFFYQEDLKHPLESRLKRLESIVYHEELGSVGDKVRRIEELALEIGKERNLSEDDLEKVTRAATLSKADLVTLMVGEFPELEGRMGEEYALKSGEDEAVAKAIYEHYLPKQSGDDIPSSDIGAIISIADKLDTVVTSFGIGLIPTGSQDPHGLRRQTAGIVQIISTKQWETDIIELLQIAITTSEKRGLLKRDKETVLEDLIEFLKLRIKNILQEQGVRYDVVDSILKTDIGQLHTLFNKATFLNEQLSNPDFKSAVEAFSRVTNIAKKADNQTSFIESKISLKEEKELLYVKKEVEERLTSLLRNGNVQDAYEELTKLVPAIHNYFDNVMVMDDDMSVKINRLNQMKETSSLITSFADFQSIVFHTEE
ncbi:glycine--tRNA ligase subunit beta [Evansella sp. AB-rgal1]|uniref:glycine--tRNA ligase subunit beta n=1 Tax=Evansella sp. AB-rgal1 TaxID=3242696 RepID=UPI00359EAA56